MGDEHFISSTHDGSMVSLDKSTSVINLTGAYDVVRDSHKVHSSPIADCKHSEQAGKIITVHKDGRLLAYSLQLKDGSTGIRIVDWATKGRCLIKGIQAPGCDLAWSYTSSPPLLAAVDVLGNIYVHAIYSKNNTVQSSPFISIIRNDTASVTKEVMDEYTRPGATSYRCTWCPYVPDKDNESAENRDDSVIGENDAPDEIAHLLTVYRGDRVEIFLLDTILEQFGERFDGNNDVARVPFDWLTECPTGFIVVSDQIKEPFNVTCVCIAPDGTALALANDVGEVRFYVMEKVDDIRLAHAWKPHGGLPVNNVVFLDNVLGETNCDQFWRYGMTGANGNRELKLWNCEDWTCVSQLSINQPGAVVENQPPLKLTVDATGSVVLLSDLERSAFYLIELGTKNGEVVFVSFNDFPLCYPILDMSIVKVVKKARSSNGSCEQLESDAECNDQCVQCVLFAINHKSVLRLEIIYDSPTTGSKISYVDPLPAFDPARTLLGYVDHLSDVNSTINTSHDSFASANTTAKVQPQIDATVSSNNGATVSSTATFVPPPPVIPDVVHPPPHRAMSTSSEEDPRQSSQVYRILLGAQQSTGVEAVPQVDDVDEADEDNDDNDEVLEDEDYEEQRVPRPDTPVAHTLAENEDYEDVGDTEDRVRWTATNSESVPDERIDLMSDKLTKIAMELERLVVHSERQSTEIVDVKSKLANLQHAYNKPQPPPAVIPHNNDALAAQLAEVLILVKEQRAKTDECVRQVSLIQQQQLSAAAAQPLVHDQMSKHVVESMRAIEQILKDEVNAKLANTETVLRDAVVKMVKNKSVTDATAKAVADMVSVHIRSSYKEMFEKVAIPEFEASLKRLFDEINKVFQRGTKDYLEQLHAQSVQLQANQGKWHADQATNMNATLEQQLAVMNKNVDMHMSKLTETLRTTIAESTSSAQAALNDTIMMNQSRSHTPAPSSRDEVKRRVQQALQLNAYNDAFSMALNAQDLHVLLWTLNRCEPDLLTISPCPVSQLILLSLMSQLTHELAVNADLKFKWLSRVVVAIDTTDKQIQECAPKINEAVMQSLNAFIVSQPSSEYTSQARMLLLAVRSLCVSSGGASSSSNAASSSNSVAHLKASNARLSTSSETYAHLMSP